MRRSAPRFVLDASVVIKLFVEEPLSDRVFTLCGRLSDESGTRLIVPDLLYAECANILWKYTVRFGMSAREARRKLEQLHLLALDSLPTKYLLRDALRTAISSHISVYDAVYLATAKRVNAPLITADEKLFSKVSGPTPRIELLSRFEA